jgi:hypothetical protein
MSEDFDDRGRLVDDLSRVALPSAASIRRRAVKRRRVRLVSLSTVLIAAGVTVAAVTLGSDHRSSIRVVTTTPTTPSTITESNSTTETTSPTPSGPGYTAARQQIIGEGLVGGGYLENVPWGLAVFDLKSGEYTDTGNKSEYPTVITALQNLETLPDTDATPAQQAEARSDVSVLNGFFGLEQAASCGPDTSALTNEAATSWFTEPDNTTSGVVVSALKAAVTDLQGAETENPAGTACYPAAIDDLIGLESATQGDIAASAAPGDNHAVTMFGDEIAYLNEFFLNFAPPGYWSSQPLTEPCPSCT